MERPKQLKHIKMQFGAHPACVILGPRQVGKTTLARMFLEQDSPKSFHFFDLENPLDLARLENPMLTLSQLPDKLIIIDEIQRAPELFPVIRVLIDEKQKKQKFLVLGSASRDLIR
jgi:predicted AAA+ superfamily ATPase